MRNVDEFMHNVKLAAEQQSGGYAPMVYGHIASYDPKTHRVRLYLPSVRNEDGSPLLTNWMPLGTGMAGNNWGAQYAPMGGATADNPTGGELCVVQRFDRFYGVQAVASLVFNQVNVPPFTELQPGEIGIKAQSGAFLYLKTDGSATVDTSAMNAPITLNAGTGNVVIMAAMAQISAMGGTLHKLVTDAFQALFNTHTHPGNDLPPDQQMDTTELTSVLEAE